MFLNQNPAPAPAEEEVHLSEADQAVLEQCAVQLGVLVTPAEAEAISSLYEAAAAAPLSEQQNIVRLNRDAKLSSLTVRSALVIARAKGDPMYAKYAKVSQLRRTYRGQLVKKYQGQASSTARKLLANAGRMNLVEVPRSPLSNPNSK